MKIREKDLRSQFADLLTKGSMKPADVDAIVKARRDDGDIEDEPGEDDEDLGAAEVDKAAANLKKAREDFAATLKKGDGEPWPDNEDVETPGGGATNPETRPPAQKTPVDHNLEFDGIDVVTVMTDICKAITDDTLVGVRAENAKQRGFIASLVKGLGEVVSAQAQQIDALTKAQTAHGKSQRKRIDLLVKALNGKAGESPFPTIDIKSLEVLGGGGGGAPPTNTGTPVDLAGAISDWANEQISALRKGGADFRANDKVNDLREAVHELDNGADPKVVAKRIGYPLGA